MPTGLIRRGGRYSVRRRIPTDLVDWFNRREIVRALGTADPKEARRLLPLSWSALDVEFDNARQNMTVEPSDFRPHTEISTTLVSLINLDRLRLERDLAAKQGCLAEFIRRERETLQVVQAMLDGERSASDDLRVLEGQRNALNALLSGENSFAVSAARKARQDISDVENQLRRLVTTTWSELIDRWAKERKKDLKSRKAHEAVVAWFTERVGEREVEEVTKRDVLDFKDKLLAENVSPANINTKLTKLRTLLNYAFDNDLIGSKPASGVRVQDDDAVRNRRKPFDAKALASLFSGPVHQLGHRPLQGRGEAAFWLPLIALYTGARMEEIGQLRPSDVAEHEYLADDGSPASTWAIRITTDGVEDMRLKNSGSERLVPVHPELERLGFVDFCKQAQIEGRKRLFADLRPNVYGILTAKWGEWFSRYLRTVCDVSDKRIVFHSLRHTFKDNARNSSIPEGIQRQLMGHSGRDVADSYGSGYSLKLLTEAVRSYKVSGMPNVDRKN